MEKWVGGGGHQWYTRDLEAVIKSAAGEASPEGFASRKSKLSSRDQVHCYRSLPDGVGSTRMTARQADSGARGAPQAVGEAALAAKLITA